MSGPNVIQLPVAVGEWLSGCGAVITAELKRKSGDIIMVGRNFTMMMCGVSFSRALNASLCLESSFLEGSKIKSIAQRWHPF